MRVSRLAGLLIAVASLAVLVGCAATDQRGQTCLLTSQGLESVDPAVQDSLAVAEYLYREALRLYVADDWDGAGLLLEDALSTLNSIRPSSEPAASTKSSLTSRIGYFLDILETKGYETVPPKSATTLVPPETDRADIAPPEQKRVTRDTSSPIRVIHNDRTDKWMRYFCGDGKRDMTRWLGRRSKYKEFIESILAEHELPPDLLYLAMIESGMNPHAYSRAHAVGMWQFISSRARIYGLRVDWWVDERRDPEKATRAACAYLKDLYEMFGSWPLALAAYNSGEGRVARARKKQPSCRDYWCLDLPRETENFVPKFMAALTIGTNPKEHGFTTWKPEPRLEYDTIEVHETTDLSVVAEASGTSSDVIKALNPALRRFCTPPNERSYEVRVPLGSGSRCLAELAKIPPSERVAWRRHRISRGETLSEIASAYGSSTRAICEVNNIRNPHRIRAGQYVLVPVGPSDGSGMESYAAGGQTTTYVVRRGDTVTSIARRHGKSTSDVLRWNGLGWRTRIYPGDRIKIKS